jgi:hypothetical protein
VIGQLADVARPALIAPRWVIGAVTVTRPIGRDEPCSLAGRDSGQTRKVIARARRSMERDYWRTIRNAVLDPRELTTIREFKQSGIRHGA